MRRQVLVPLMLFGTLAVVALVVLACEALSASRTQELTITRSAVVEHIVRQAEQAVEGAGTASLERYLERFAEVYGESVVVVDSVGDPIASIGGLDADDAEVAELIAAATSNLPQWDVPTVRPWSPDVVLVAEPILGLGEASAGAVVLEIDMADARADVTRSWALVGLVGLVFLAGLAAASLWWTRWVLRPVRALDAAANAFPAHVGPAEDLASGPPELRRLAASFTRMADGVERTLDQQRAFVADASHQLRNPLAAIRLRVDALEPADRGEVDAVDHDLDSLERTVDRMLALADVEHRATAEQSGASSAFADDSRREHTVLSAAALVEPFRPLVVDAGLTLAAVGDATVRIACRRSDLEEIVGTLLDNVVRYAGEGSTVTVRLERDGDFAHVTVSDDGPGLGADELRQAGTRFWRSPRHRAVAGTGLGLAIVRELVRANGGRFALDGAPEGGLRARATFGALE